MLFALGFSSLGYQELSITDRANIIPQSFTDHLFLNQDVVYSAGDSEVRGLVLCHQEARSSPSAAPWCQICAVEFSILLEQPLAYFHFYLFNI